MAKLTIIVDVREERTMSQYAVPKTKKIIFDNASAEGELVVTPKGEGPSPFCRRDDQGNETKLASLVVPVDQGGDKASRKGVWICKDYAGAEVLYTAQIGSFAAEDPIIIFERGKVHASVIAAAVVGVAVGVVITVAAMRAFSRKTPRQG